MKNLILIVALLTLITGCFPSNNLSKQEVLLQGKTMGTTYNIKVIVENDSFNTESLQKDIDIALVNLNQEMSTYIADSELSLFNQLRSSNPVTISNGLTRVMKEAIRLGELSNGKLDVTIGPLVNLWGFGPEYRLDKVPSNELLQETKNRIGIENITLNGNKLSKKIDMLVQ